MNFYRIVYHLIATFVDTETGRTQYQEVGQPTEIAVMASSIANAQAAIAATLTIPDNGSLNIQSVNLLASNVLVGS